MTTTDTIPQQYAAQQTSPHNGGLKQALGRIRSQFSGINSDALFGHIAYILVLIFLIVLKITNGIACDQLNKEIFQNTQEANQMKNQQLIIQKNITDIAQQGNLNLKMQPLGLKPLSSAAVTIKNDSLKNDYYDD